MPTGNLCAKSNSFLYQFLLKPLSVSIEISVLLPFHSILYPLGGFAGVFFTGAQILGQAGIIPGPKGARNNQLGLAPSAGAMVVGSSKHITKKPNKQVRNAELSPYGSA